MNSIAVLGSTGGVGATMVSLSIAEEISKRDESCLHIYGSGKIGSYYKDVPFFKSIDDLKGKLESGRITSADLGSVIEKRDVLDCIAATRSSFKAVDFPIDTFEKIISAGNDYKHIVIDAGSDLTSSLSISAFNACDDIIFIVDQRPSTLARFNEIYNSLPNIKVKHALVILNNYEKDKGQYSLSEAENICGAPISQSIPYSVYGRQSEYYGDTLRHDVRYRKAIEKIVNRLKGTSFVEKASRDTIKYKYSLLKDKIILIKDEVKGAIGR